MVYKAKPAPAGYQKTVDWAAENKLTAGRAVALIHERKFHPDDYIRRGNRFFIRIGAQPSAKVPRVPVGFVSLSEWAARKNCNYQTARSLVQGGHLEITKVRGFIFLSADALPNAQVAAAVNR